jgi:hypothetical protein
MTMIMKQMLMKASILGIITVCYLAVTVILLLFTFSRPQSIDVNAAIGKMAPQTVAGKANFAVYNSAGKEMISDAHHWIHFEPNTDYWIYAKSELCGVFAGETVCQ